MGEEGNRGRQGRSRYCQGEREREREREGEREKEEEEGRKHGKRRIKKVKEKDGGSGENK